MIKNKVAISAAILAVFQLGAKLLDLVALIVLARFLTPAEFGLVAIAMSVLLILTAATDLPVIDVLVQREDISKRDVDAAFTTNLLRGLIVCAFLAVIAYPIAIFYSDNRLILITFVLGLVPLGKSLESPALVHFIREVNYKPTAQVFLVGKVTGALLSIGLAITTHSFWALIAGVTSASLASAAWSYVRAPYRPRIEFLGVGKILSFAGWVTVSRIIFTANQQGDRFFLGHILGKAPLGQYSMGSEMSSLATYSLAGPIMRPVFAGMARIQHDIERLRASYLKSQQVLTMAVLPIGSGLAAVAAIAVPLVLGPEWNDAKVVIWWLAPVVALQMLSVPVQAAAMARAQPAALAVREGIAFFMRLPVTIWAAIYFGLEGAAIARSLSGLVIIVVNMGIAQRLIGVSILKQFSAVWRSLVSAAAMAGILLLYQMFGVDYPTIPLQIAELVFLVVLGMLSYAIIHLTLWRLTGSRAGAETFFLELIKTRGKLS